MGLIHLEQDFRPDTLNFFNGIDFSSGTVFTGIFLTVLNIFVWSGSKLKTWITCQKIITIIFMQWLHYLRRFRKDISKTATNGKARPEILKHIMNRYGNGTAKQMKWVVMYYRYQSIKCSYVGLEKYITENQFIFLMYWQRKKACIGNILLCHWISNGNDIETKRNDASIIGVF